MRTLVWISLSATSVALGAGHGPVQSPASSPLTSTGVTVQAQDGGPDVIDFEGLTPGTIPTSVFGAGGTGPILVSGFSPGFGAGVNAAVVFDSANPTGEDFDLGTPNQTCPVPGPGVGSGGEVGSPNENCTAQGHVLIVGEDLVDTSPADGLVDDPDDADLIGSSTTFDFSALGTVSLCGLTLIDVEADRPAAEVVLTLANTSTIQFVLPQTGDNGVVELMAPCGLFSGVVSATVTLNGSGAIDDLVFQVDQTVCSPCIELILKCDDADAGREIPFLGRVGNCGDIELTDVRVMHDNGTPLDTSDDVNVLSIPFLGLGEKMDFVGSYASSTPGSPSTLTGTAVGSPPPACGLGDVSQTTSATCTQEVWDACVTVVVKCADAGPGQPIPFMGRVTNCGDVDLTNVMVAHDNGTPLDTSDDVNLLSIPLLPPDQKMPFNGSYVSSTPGVPSTLTVTSIGTPPEACGLDDVTSTSSATCTQAPCDACVEVVVKCNDAGAGQPITFLGRFDNCGDVPLMNVMLAHDNGTPLATGDDVLITTVPLLPPGDKVSFNGSYSPSVPPGTPSTLTVTVIGAPPVACGGDVSGTSSATCTQAP